MEIYSYSMAYWPHTKIRRNDPNGNIKGYYYATDKN